MRVLDLFCGEGGASRGYHDAGMIVVGVDSNPKCIERYPYSAFIGDWRHGLDYWLSRTEIDLIHASPPCQRYSKLARVHPGTEYPDLIGPVRALLMETEIPWVLENVPEAPLLEPVYLCGSMFPQLSGTWKGQHVILERQRGFEATFPLTPPVDCTCDDYPNVPVYGHGCPGNQPWFRGPGFSDLTKQVMGIHWMSRDGLTEAIPPAYAEYVGYSFQFAATGTMIHVRDRSPEARGVDLSEKR